MTEEQERLAVEAEALTWVGTPFHWEACVKGAGVDCGRFPAAVFNTTGVKKIDIAGFPRMSPQWFMHHSDNSYLDQLKLYTSEYELTPGRVPQRGDIVVAKYGRDWAHAAIVMEWPKVIAATAGSSVTVWQNIYTCPHFAQRQMKFLDPWGKHD